MEKFNSNKKNVKNLKQKKDCCMQSLKEVNCFLCDFSKVKKAIKISKWIR